MIPTDQARTDWADAVDAGPAPVQLDGPQGSVPAMTGTTPSPTIDGGPAPRQGGGDLSAGEIVFDSQVNDAGAAPEAPRDRDDDSEARP
ncbi:hypothetical protein ACIBI7_24595 [Nonomuraea fuscirosea]|uniref:hypothetical protein n=1 Tax=Nonomuraea fuscirosea TaxID=1291556 RepID=UPI003789F0B9